MSIRAAGYDLEDPGIIEMPEGAVGVVDLKLHPTADLAAQLTNGEWLMSIEGVPEQKTGLQVRLDLLDTNRCTMCHALYYVVKNGHDAAEWVGVLQRMAYHNPGSTPFNPTDNPNSPRYRRFWEGWPNFGASEDPERISTPNGTSSRQPVAEQAAWLASINLSSDPEGTWKYPLRTLPRPKGAETNVIITQYDLPRIDSEPHDAVVDHEGMVWYLDFGFDYMGRLNPVTGDVREWRLPSLKPFPPFAEGGLDLEIDWEDNPWVALMRRPALLRFDKKTEKMTVFPAPRFDEPRGGVGFLAHSPNTRMVWFTGAGGANGIDMTTNRITKTWPVPTRSYGMEANSKGNLFFFSLFNGEIAELDTATGQGTVYKTPTPDSGPRRGFIDRQDKVWFAEYLAGQFGMFDPDTKQIKEWRIAVPYADPYDVVRDRDGIVWSGGMVTDYIFRLDPASGEISKYLLPTLNTNIRRIDVDNRGPKVSVWIGENHHARITRVELRDQPGGVR
jgi:streptogramin lyase